MTARLAASFMFLYFLCSSLRLFFTADETVKFFLIYK